MHSFVCLVDLARSAQQTVGAAGSHGLRQQAAGLLLYSPYDVVLFPFFLFLFLVFIYFPPLSDGGGGNGNGAYAID